MLKFFRKVRRKLLREGNLKRYLIYAIGEILLVTIGILLALQVNNWNDRRINSELELKALKDLRAELVLNKDRILRKQNARRLMSPQVREYIHLISEGKANYDLFRKSHNSAYMFGMTNPSIGVIESLISSGEISLLSNDSLKYLLTDWKDQLGNLHENEVILWNAGLDYNDSFSDVVLDPKQIWKDWEKTDYQESFQNLLSDVNYRNKLISLHRSNEITIRNCDLIIATLDNIIAIIVEEIEKHQS